jgi:hypothetical protein
MERGSVDEQTLPQMVDAWFEHAPRYLTLPAQAVLLIVVLAIAPLLVSARFRNWLLARDAEETSFL